MTSACDNKLRNSPSIVLAIHHLCPMLKHFRTLFASFFVIVAAMSATLLSGLEFPGANNVWHIPIVLDFANSTEGPHDAYHNSFDRFISFFWLGVRLITNESKLETVFVWLQLTGNALLAMTIFLLAQAAAGTTRLVSFSTAALCFAYGLWGHTRLGYSELFVTFATHTQFAIVGALIAALFLSRYAFLRAAFVLGIAANVNLFIAAWTFLTALFFIIFAYRTRLIATLSGFSFVFLAASFPVLVWLLRLRLGAPPSTVTSEFYAQFLAGHVYAFQYPQAFIHTLALGISAGLAAHVSGGEAGSTLSRLGILILCAVVTLVVAAALPYAIDVPLLLNLHPLRYASIVVLLSAACAAALVASKWQYQERLLALIAAAGFMVQLPLVSVLGFSLLIPADTCLLRAVRFLLPTAAAIGMAFASPSVGMPANAVFAAMTLMAIVAVSIAGDSGRDGSLKKWLTGCLVWVFSAASMTPNAGEEVLFSLLFSMPATLALAVNEERQDRQGAALAVMGIGMATLFFGFRESPFIILSLSLGLMTIGLAPIVGQFLARRRVQFLRFVLTSLVLGFVVSGLMAGAKAGFWINNNRDLRDFLDAQRWARAHTPPGTLFYSPDAFGFSLFSRRPVWWDASQMVAVLWAPELLSLLKSRHDKARFVNKPSEFLALVESEKIAFLVLRVSKRRQELPSLEVVFKNQSYVILSGVSASPVANGESN
jgi:hypothetical protein